MKIWNNEVWLESIQLFFTISILIGDGLECYTNLNNKCMCDYLLVCQTIQLLPAVVLLTRVVCVLGVHVEQRIYIKFCVKLVSHKMNNWQNINSVTQFKKNIILNHIVTILWHKVLWVQCAGMVWMFHETQLCGYDVTVVIHITRGYSVTKYIFWVQVMDMLWVFYDTYSFVGTVCGYVVTVIRSIYTASWVQCVHIWCVSFIIYIASWVQCTNLQFTSIVCGCRVSFMKFVGKVYKFKFVGMMWLLYDICYFVGTL